MLPAMQCFTILQVSSGRRKLLTLQFTITDVVAIGLILHIIFEGMRIGEAAHPGPRLRRRGPRSLDSRTARRNREGPVSDIPKFEPESCEKGLTMLHLNLRSYISHIAETTALLRAIKEKPLRVCLNETFLHKAVEMSNWKGIRYSHGEIGKDNGEAAYWYSFWTNISLE